MSVVTVAYFRTVTGDQTTAATAVQEFLDDAESMVEDYLGRTLAYGTYTEKLKVWPSGFAYPTAIPLDSVAASSAAEVYDVATLYGVEPDDRPFTGFMYLDPEHGRSYSVGDRIGTGYETNLVYATITYTGGYTADTMPVRLKRAIVDLAQALDPNYTSNRPDGAMMARVGDVQVSYDRGSYQHDIDQWVPGLSKRLSGYRLKRK